MTFFTYTSYQLLNQFINQLAVGSGISQNTDILLPAVIIDDLRGRLIPADLVNIISEFFHRLCQPVYRLSIFGDLCICFILDICFLILLTALEIRLSLLIKKILPPAAQLGLGLDVSPAVFQLEVDLIYLRLSVVVLFFLIVLFSFLVNSLYPLVGILLYLFVGLVVDVDLILRQLLIRGLGCGIPLLPELFFSIMLFDEDVCFLI